MTLQINSVAPYFVLMSVFLFVGSLMSRTITFYRKQYESRNLVRFQSVDGLRGFLALSVMFIHGLLNYGFLQTGAWKIDDVLFYGLFGTAAVSLFFMITGFLFWSKIIKNGGSVDWKTLYFSRFMRLVPMYVTAVLCVFILTGIQTHWTLVVSWPELLASLGRWFTFNILGQPDINGLRYTFTLMAGVIWTLRYELGFTFVLPFMAYFASKSKFFVLCAAMLVLYFFYDATNIINFIGGMTASYFANNKALRDFFARTMSTTVPIISLVGLYVATDHGFVVAQPFLLFVFFISIVCGNNLFGLLTTRGAQYLGTVSYSLYLIHGIVISILLMIAAHYDIAITPWNFWLLILLCGVSIVVISGFTYRYIEFPFIEMGSGIVVRTFKRHNNPKKNLSDMRCNQSAEITR